MKTILLCLLIGFTLSYNAQAAVNYARKYWSHYNSKYANYASKGGDCSNFVSQCLIAGGQSLAKCKSFVSWYDNYGCLPRVRDLDLCLQKLGWKRSTSKPPGFKAGYPMILTDLSHAIIATSVSGNKIKYAGHTTNRFDYPLGSSVYYYYL